MTVHAIVPSLKGSSFGSNTIHGYVDMDIYLSIF